MTVNVMETRDAPIRVAIAGLGAIGLRVAEILDEGLPGFVLAAIAVRDRKRAGERLRNLRTAVSLVPSSWAISS